MNRLLAPLMVIRLESPYPTDEVGRRLPSIVRPSRSDFIWPTRSSRAAGQTAPFEGSVWPHGFEIRRLITNRNEFLPVVRGSILEAEGGTHLRLAMALHPASAVFTLVLLGVFVLAVVLPGGEGQRVETLLWPMILAGLVTIWSLYSGFYVEAVEAERLIRDCVAGRPKRG